MLTQTRQQGQTSAEGAANQEHKEYRKYTVQKKFLLTLKSLQSSQVKCSPKIASNEFTIGKLNQLIVLNFSSKRHIPAYVVSNEIYFLGSFFKFLPVQFF